MLLEEHVAWGWLDSAISQAIRDLIHSVVQYTMGPDSRHTSQVPKARQSLPMS